MNIKEFIKNVCKEIKYKKARKPISDELELHINEIKNENLCEELTEIEAEEKAVKQMGNPNEIGKKLNKIHKPKLDWITLILMIALILMGANYKKLFYPDVFWGGGFVGLNNFLTAKVEYIIYIFTILFSITLYFYDYRKISKYSKLLYIFATILNIIACVRGFRANGNMIYGLWPITSVSPTVFSIPLYIISFAGFVNEVNKKDKIKTTTQNKKILNNNTIITILNCLSIITTLMINFVSGFLLSTVYLIIIVLKLLKQKEIKKMLIFIVISIISFLLFSTVIYIIPTKLENNVNPLSSSLWVGIDTPGKIEIQNEREKVFQNAKLFGAIDNANIIGFGRIGIFSILGIISQYGWIVGILWILFLLIFNIKLITSVIKIKESYGKLIAIGIVSLYSVQTICNILMNFGIIGIAEFNIPLLSVGDVEFLINLLSMSLILSIYRRKDINFEEPKKSKLVENIENFFFEEA